MSKSKKKSRVKKNIIETVIIVAAILVAFFILSRFIGTVGIVNGDSMNPTLSNGNLVVIDEKAYSKENIERFDLVVFPYGNDKHYIKRVIGMPGEAIAIKDGKIVINGTVVKEYYGMEDIKDDTNIEDVVRLGENEYFVMGDNRNNSVDSRTIGPITSGEITGKVVFRILPLNGFGSLKGL